MLQARPIKKLVVIAGPTAVGKTEITLKLAKLLQCPILSADARQCYRELGVATAKPAPIELEQIPHYFINSHSIFEPVSAAGFEDYALKKLHHIYAENHFCLMTGGSGLYIDAVCKGLDEMPEIPSSITAELNSRWEKEGLNPLLSQLKELDPRFFQLVDRANYRRVIRALEVSLATGRPYSDFRKESPQSRNFEVISIGLNRDRQQLYRRIETRMDHMIDNGLFEEAATLYPHRHLRPLQTVGYQEIFKYINGEIDKDEAVRLLKRNSRRYAKRQLTWMRNHDALVWFSADDFTGIRDFILSRIKY